MVISRILEVLALLGLMVLVRFLSISGQISLLINPRYEILVSVASVWLVLAAIWTFFRGDIQRRSRHHTANVLIVIIVVAISTQIPLQSLSSETAKNRGVTSRVLSVNEVKYQEAINTPADERELTQWVRILTQHEDPRAFLGQEVTLEGMVVTIPSLPENTIMLARFVVSCCIADARPLALLVSVEDPTRWENNDWLRVNGTIELGEYEGKQRGVIKAREVELIPEPESPYVFEY